MWSRNKAVRRQSNAARLCIRYLILGIKASEAKVEQVINENCKRNLLRCKELKDYKKSSEIKANRRK